MILFSFKCCLIESDLIIQKKEEDISNSEKGNQDFEKIISQKEKRIRRTKIKKRRGS